VYGEFSTKPQKKIFRFWRKIISRRNHTTLGQSISALRDEATWEITSDQEISSIAYRGMDGIIPILGEFVVIFGQWMIIFK
jgi:hypothetical protein